MNMAVTPGDTLLLDSWRVKKLSLEHREFINSQLAASSCQTSNWYNDFSYFWLFSEARAARKVVWKTFDTLVVLFVINTKHHKAFLLRPPFGVGSPEDYVRTLYTCLAFCHHYNNGRSASEAVVRSVDEAELEFMSRSPMFHTHFTIKPRNGIEHHYRIDDLCSLNGSQFGYVRRKLSKFARSYPDCVVRPYVQSDRERMLVLFERWLGDAKTDEERERKKGERRYFLASLKYALQPDYLFLVADVGGELAGMISGGIRAAGDSWCFQRKTLHAYEGLAERLVVELAKAVHAQDPNVEFLNDGSDLEDPGLRYFKQHFNPGRTLKRYRLYAKL